MNLKKNDDIRTGSQKCDIYWILVDLTSSLHSWRWIVLEILLFARGNMAITLMRNWLGSIFWKLMIPPFRFLYKLFIKNTGQSTRSRCSSPYFTRIVIGAQYASFTLGKVGWGGWNVGENFKLVFSNFPRGRRKHLSTNLAFRANPHASVNERFLAFKHTPKFVSIFVQNGSLY